MEAPLRDTVGKYKLLAMYGALKDYFTPELGEMREVWFTTTLHHREKPGTLKKEMRLIGYIDDLSRRSRA